MANADNIIKRLSAQWGNDWPDAALERLLHLSAKEEYEGLCVGAERECHALKAWALDTIKAGIAFRQSKEAA